MTLFEEVQTTQKPNPEHDGRTHINIYSNGRTTLGRFLSNFAEVSLELNDYHFSSIEAYWYWLGLKDRASESELKSLRYSYGANAKRFGQQLQKKYGRGKVDGFEELICIAIRQKMEKAPRLILDTFYRSTLPFEHYYVMRGRVIDVKNSYPWMMEFFETLRSEEIGD